jgi:hypothetical protein
MSPFEIAPNWYVYGKRRHVPEKCPRCGCKPVEYDGTISSLLKGFYGAWRIQKVKHWGMKRWGAYCGRCGLRDAMSQPSPFLEVLKQRTYYAQMAIPKA